MESHKIQIKPSASKELDLVGSKKDRRIVSRIYSLADDPRPTGSEKLTAEEDKYRVRQGNYRVVYSINDQQRLVVVTKVGHRREVYR